MKRFPKLLLAALLLIPSAACAEKPLVVGVADDLILKEQRSRAERVLGELIDLIGEELSIPTKLVLIPSGTQKAIDDTVRDVQQGRLHLVAANGLEFGWLRQRSGGRIQPLVVSDQNFQVVQYEHVIVRQNTFKQFADLQGASLILYDQPYPSLLIYMSQLRKTWGPNLFHEQRDPVQSGSRAMQAVLAGKADATIVDLYTMQGFQKVFPGQMAKLEVLDRSAAYPLAPVGGDEQKVNQLRPKLWQGIQNIMTQIHTNPRARAFLDVWRVRRFRLPDAEFDDLTEKATQDFPLNALPKAPPR